MTFTRVFSLISLVAFSGVLHAEGLVAEPALSTKPSKSATPAQTTAASLALTPVIATLSTAKLLSSPVVLDVKPTTSITLKAATIAVKPEPALKVVASPATLVSAAKAPIILSPTNEAVSTEPATSNAALNVAATPSGVEMTPLLQTLATQSSGSSGSTGACGGTRSIWNTTVAGASLLVASNWSPPVVPNQYNDVYFASNVSVSGAGANLAYCSLNTLAGLSYNAGGGSLSLSSALKINGNTSITNLGGTLTLGSQSQFGANSTLSIVGSSSSSTLPTVVIASNPGSNGSNTESFAFTNTYVEVKDSFDANSVTLTNSILTMTDPAYGYPNVMTLAGALTIDAQSQLDLGSNDLVIHSNPAVTVSEINTYVANVSFFNNFSGMGGIGSHTLYTITGNNQSGNNSVPEIYGLATVQNNSSNALNFPLSGPNARSVNPGDIEVGMTYWGDANLDGQVDGSDYSIYDANYGVVGTGLWQIGDFNYDGNVDGSDASVIDNSYNNQNGNFANLPCPLVPATYPIANSTLYKNYISQGGGGIVLKTLNEQ